VAIWLAAISAAVAQESGCAPAISSYDQIGRQLMQAKAQARAAGCTGLAGLFKPRAVCAGVTAQVKVLEAQLRQVRRQQMPQRAPAPVFGTPFGERVMLPDCGRPAYRSARVVCVRLCDGYYFPVNHSIKQKNLAKDEEKCLAQYPEGQAALYIDRSGGENIAGMVSMDGKLKYGDQPFAFAFQQRFDPACPRPGAHLADAARAAATETATHSAGLVRAAIAVQAGNGDAVPSEVRLVGPPYAYYFPERGADDGVSDRARAPEPGAAVPTHADASAAAVAVPTSVRAIVSDEQAVLTGD
jgi:hypothetical protein